MSRCLAGCCILWAAGISQVLAGSFSDLGSGRVDYRAAIGGPGMNCGELVQLTDHRFSVVSAARHGDACRVQGLIPQEIRFEVNLPTAWNGRLLMTGNGGLAGQPLEDESYQQNRDGILSYGFATAYTDTGHDNRVEPGASFAHNNLAKLIDYGYRGVHLTNQVARELIATYYGQPLRYAYFSGCSNGGRQAFMEAQRFPRDFDGILAGAPAFEFTGLKFSQAQRMQAVKSKPLSTTEVQVLAEHIYNKCDANDGLADGLLEDPRPCRFDPKVDLPRCLGPDLDECFTDDEVTALDQYYAPVVLAGELVYPAFPVGSEVTGPTWRGRNSGWVPWVINDHGRALLDVLGSEFFRYIAFIEDRPDYNWQEFDFKSAPDNLAEARKILDATDPNLEPFARRGGKLLTYFGWADPDINPLTVIAYHDAVTERFGARTGEFFRLFMVPGMFHCSGGPGPFDFDAMTPLIDWVETGKAPEQITGTHRFNGHETYTRPLCPWPKQAVFNGEGDVNRAENFTCQKPDT